jgi:PAS domain S-box-containing protein
MLESSLPDRPVDGTSLFEQQQLALEASGTGLWTWDVATDAVTWTAVCYTLVGADPAGDPLTFAGFLERVHEDDRGTLQAAVAASLAEGGKFEHSFRVVLPDGSVRWLVNHGRAVCSAAGRPIRMLGSVQDVSRQKHAEQRYAESEERLSLAVEASGLGIWTWDISTGRVSWSKRCYEIHGLEEDQFAGTLEAFAALVHPEDRDRVLRSVQAAIAAHLPYVSEFRIVRPHGEVAWVTNRGRASYASDGTAVSVVGTIGDITSLKKNATALHAALSASRTGTFHWDILTNGLTWDDELDRLFGLSPGSTVRSLDQFISLVHPDDRTEVIAACERCRIDGADFDLEYRVVLPDGRLRWLYDRGLTFRDAAGRPASMTGACVDITARVAADRALALNRSRLDYATRLSGVGFWYCDLPFDVLEWDDRVREHFFFDGGARITIDDFYARIHEEDRLPTRAAIEASLSSRTPYDVVYRTVHPTTGAVKWIRALGGTDYASDGTPTHFDGVTVDVTAQKLDQQKLSMLNEQLRAQDRLKDEFIATLSHELRNPLAPIRAAAKAIASPQLTAAQLQRAQAIIQRQVTNMSLLLDDLLDIARITQGKLTIKKTAASVVDVVDAAVESVRPMLNAKSQQLSLSLPTEPLSISADPLRLSQILANLLTNAAKYSDPGSDINLAVTVIDRTLVLSVKDQGIGIAPDSIGAIFDMFSQVEGAAGMSDGGLGIGLALVKGLAELHGGTVEARSPGVRHGSEFIVRLPIVQQLPAKAPASDAVATTDAVRQKVLVADDNHDAAESIAMILELAGHEVRVANSGQAALSLAQLFRPDTVVLDIGMPDLSGYQVAQRLRQEPWGKDIQLIALTGWGQDSDRRRALESGFDEHLSKPVEPESLEALINSRSSSQA